MHRRKDSESKRARDVSSNADKEQAVTNLRRQEIVNKRTNMWSC